MVGSGAAAASGVATFVGSEQLVLVCTLSGLTALLLVSVLLLLCASCQGQKKTAGHPESDQVKILNGMSERETISQSGDSPATDLAVSSSHNGPLTSGTVLTDTQDISPQPSEEMLSSQSELRSSKYHQDRELPSIPPNNTLLRDGPPASGDSTYEVVKEIAPASRDVSVEDSLYETVKELKDPPVQHELPNGMAQLTSKQPPQPPPTSLLHNGHNSPCTPERGPLCAGVEYATVDLKKKSRHSADLEAKRRSDHVDVPAHKPLEVDEVPPPVPAKVLDENDNQSAVVNGLMGAGLHNGELHSPLSPAPVFENHILPDSESVLYSTVNKTNGDGSANEDDKEHDYSSIAELKGLVPASSSSDLYATVNDMYPHQPNQEDDSISDSMDPGYETIRIPKTSSSDDEHRVVAGAEGSDTTNPEPDYESVSELGLNREMSRL